MTEDKPEAWVGDHDIHAVLDGGEGPMSTAKSAREREDTSSLSAECALAQRPEYQGLHGECRQTEDVHLPHSTGLLLVRRCTCSCHGVEGAGP